jgi:hypothetical protein
MRDSASIGSPFDQQVELRRACPPGSRPGGSRARRSPRNRLQPVEEVEHDLVETADVLEQARASSRGSELLLHAAPLVAQLQMFPTYPEA